MSTSTVPVKLIGTKEYLLAEVTASVTLSAQAVTIWLNGVEHPASWIGSSGTTRQCRTDTIVDFASWVPGVYAMAVEVTDSPEIPLIPAGYISVRSK